jgi:hypothetical protein
MAITDKANRKELIDGCGTILKSSRLKGGYRLVKRKRAIGSTTKAKAPAKAKVTAKAKAPAKVKVTETEKVVMVAPVTVPKKARGKKPSAMKTAIKPSVKMVTKKKATRGKRKKTAKA